MKVSAVAVAVKVVVAWWESKLAAPKEKTGLQVDKALQQKVGQVEMFASTNRIFQDVVNFVG